MVDNPLELKKNYLSSLKMLAKVLNIKTTNMKKEDLIKSLKPLLPNYII